MPGLIVQSTNRRGKLYGPAHNHDMLAETAVGQASNYSSAIRFRAAASSTITAVRNFIFNSPAPPGYWAGTGGTMQITLQTDDGTANHYPSGSVLATFTEDPPVNGTGLLRTFSSPATVAAGTLYHLVIRNTDAAYATNWFSVDNCYMWASIYGGRDFDPRDPRICDEDEAVLRRAGAGAWGIVINMIPIFEVVYGNGVHQGMGYVDGVLIKTVTGNNMVRERFTVSGGSRTVTGAYVFLHRVSGTDPFVLRLENDAGVEIESITVAAASIPIGDPPTTWKGVWAGGKFTNPHVLANGTTYRLRVSAAATTVYKMIGIEWGIAASNAYDAATVYNDGRSEYTSDGSTWLVWTRDQDDMPFYFTTMES